MAIEVVCPECHKTLRVGDHVGGKKIRCPACQGIVAVPAEEIIDVDEIYEEPKPKPVRQSGARSRPDAGETRSGSRQTPARGQSDSVPKEGSGRARKLLRKPRESRDYVHAQCGEVTTVEGPEFASLADPLAKMTATYCAECEDVFPISEFAWADTQERISDYYAHYQNRASGVQRFLGSRSAMFTLSGVAFFVGLSLTLVLGIVLGLIAGVVGAIVALVLHVMVIGPMILRQVLGTNDPRQLE
jgi:hypothetical protein